MTHDELIEAIKLAHEHTRTTSPGAELSKAKELYIELWAELGRRAQRPATESHKDSTEGKHPLKEREGSDDLEAVAVRLLQHMDAVPLRGIVIEGQPGSGKTQLLEAMRDYARSPWVDLEGATKGRPLGECFVVGEEVDTAEKAAAASELVRQGEQVVVTTSEPAMFSSHLWAHVELGAKKDR